MAVHISAEAKLKKVVILQSSYIPWRGYFDLINAADLFVFLDDVQFTSRDWRTRNQILTPQGLKWLTIPAGADRNRLIQEVEIEDQSWKKNHRMQIHHAYSKAPFYRRFEPLLEALYENSITNLSAYNQHCLQLISRELRIETELTNAALFHASGRKTERLVEILGQVGGTHYITGPSAKGYLDEEMFRSQNIGLSYFDYQGYPAYRQMVPGFHHQVSILDLLFNLGDQARNYLLTTQEGWRISWQIDRRS